MIYIAFLRGINVGGHKLIKMNELTRLVSGFGFKNVSTFIQSGNVLFESSSSSEAAVIKKMEQGFLETLGYEIKVLLRTREQITTLVTLDPFKKTGDSKNYITFLSKPVKPQSDLSITSSKKEYTVVSMTDREIFWASHKLSNGRYGNYETLEKTFGKELTTRNWNTVVKIYQRLQDQ